MSIGDALAQARSQAGLTIAQVSQRTCIRETIIAGIERGDFSACGGDFYARGHIRSIARAVGIDPEGLIREYDAAHGAQPAITAADVFEPATPIKIKERRSPHWVLAMGVVLVAVLGYGVYRALAPSSSSPPPSHPVAASTHQSSQAASAPPTATPSPSSSPSATSVRHDVVIRLVAVQDCWVGFTTPSGRFLKQAYITGGSTKTWTFYRSVDMNIGNPGGIKLTVNGKNLGSPGSAGQPVTLSLGPDKKLPSTG